MTAKTSHLEKFLLVITPVKKEYESSVQRTNHIQQISRLVCEVKNIINQELINVVGGTFLKNEYSEIIAEKFEEERIQLLGLKSEEYYSEKVFETLDIFIPLLGQPPNTGVVICGSRSKIYEIAEILPEEMVRIIQ